MSKSALSGASLVVALIACGLASVLETPPRTDLLTDGEMASIVGGDPCRQPYVPDPNSCEECKPVTPPDPTKAEFAKCECESAERKCLDEPNPTPGIGIHPWCQENTSIPCEGYSLVFSDPAWCLDPDSGSYGTPGGECANTYTTVITSGWYGDCSKPNG